MIENLTQLLNALVQLLAAVCVLIVGVLKLVLTVPVLPLALWIIFWLFAVDWVRLRELLLKKGGCVGVLLIALMTILIWGVVAPPAEGYHTMLGLHLSNFVGKTVFVTSLFCIMTLCGIVQLRGCCGIVCRPRQPGESEAAESH